MLITPKTIKGVQDCLLLLIGVCMSMVLTCYKGRELAGAMEELAPHIESMDPITKGRT